MHAASARNSRFCLQFQNSSAAKLIATKYDSEKYTFIQRASLQKPGWLEPTYQRALQGKLTADDYAVLSPKMSTTQSHSLSMSQSRGIKR